VIAIDTSTRSPSQYTFFDKAILGITSPFQAIMTATLNFGVEGYHDYIYLWDTQKENSKLLLKNQELYNLVIQLKETQAENLRLRNLLEFKESFEMKGVVARVIAQDVSPEFRAIRINRGEDDGLKANMAVVTDQGVVGRILRTTSGTADVVTILDLLSVVDSIVKRSRVRGIVEGLTDNLCQLKFALRTDDVEPGDLLISSGLGGVFPKGVPVGRVSDVKKLTYGVSQTVIVDPSVNFEKLEEVFVITESLSIPLHMSTKIQKQTAELPTLARSQP
tara:strand:- start:2737 stop:3567 length:831 start_codon:yes stop_codon:yes gene_type:complete